MRVKHPFGRDLVRIRAKIEKNRAIGIINFAKHFQNFIDDTMI